MNIDVTKFCYRCAKFGHEALKICNGCLLFDKKYERSKDKILHLMNEMKTSNDKIQYEKQTKINSKNQFNDFILQQNDIIMEKFQLLEPDELPKFHNIIR